MLSRKFACQKPIKGKIYNPGSRLEISKEPILPEIKLTVYKFNNRPKPEMKNRNVIFSCFSEFGSEIVACLYCIPMLMQSKYLGYYSIAIGWHGRGFLYKHIVDEFWETQPEHQWLRDYCRAFHHESRNLRLLEKSVRRKQGILANANELSIVALRDVLPKVNQVKPYAAYPRISDNSEKLQELKNQFLNKPRMVGITARNRRCYGRNLDIDFYKKLIDLLEEMGYNPVWLGEIATTYECPCPHIPDFRSSKHAYDLEKTLLLVSQLEFTVQFWTASSRLAGLVGVPYIIFESPDQIWGAGQEGIRLNLCTKGQQKKLVIAHFKKIAADHEHGLKLVQQAVLEIQCHNYNDIIGAVDDPAWTEFLRDKNDKRIGNNNEG